MDTLFLIALIIASIVAIAFIVERGLALRRVKVIPPAVVWAVENYQGTADLPKLVGACEQNPSSLSRLLLFTAEHIDWPRTEHVTMLETRARHEVTMLERGLVVLEIIVGIAPLLGLVGTIYGLILLFHSQGMDLTVQASNNGFARGISTALNATLLGLLVAIPALIGWSYFNRKVETLSVEIEGLCDEFLRKSYRNGEVTEGLPKIAKRA
jgi:biopolymer transport protein ExbB